MVVQAKLREFNCGNLGHVAGNCRQPCSRCGSTEHTLVKCTNYTARAGADASAAARGNGERTVTHGRAAYALSAACALPTSPFREGQQPGAGKSGAAAMIPPGRPGVGDPVGGSHSFSHVAKQPTSQAAQQETMVWRKVRYWDDSSDDEDYINGTGQVAGAWALGGLGDQPGGSAAGGPGTATGAAAGNSSTRESVAGYALHITAAGMGDQQAVGQQQQAAGEQPAASNKQQQPWGSERVDAPPDRVGSCTDYTGPMMGEPRTLDAALGGHKEEQWCVAREEETQAQGQASTWDAGGICALVARPDALHAGRLQLGVVDIGTGQHGQPVYMSQPELYSGKGKG